MCCPDDDDDDDDGDEEEEEDEDDAMKEMRLCTPWISTPFEPPPPKRLSLSLDTLPPFQDKINYWPQLC